MDYHISKFVDMSFEQAVERALEELSKEGFGLMSEIDVKASLKKKIDVDFRPYIILGSCNPQFAHKALLIEDKVGTLMPCNVVVQQHDDERVEVSAMNPAIIAQVIPDDEMAKVAKVIASKLQNVINAI